MKKTFLRTGALCLALIFILSVKVFAQPVSAGAGASANVSANATTTPTAADSTSIENTSVNLSNQTDESLMPFEAGTNAASQSGGALRTVGIFFRMLLVLAFVIAVIVFLFKYLKKKSDSPEVSSDPFLRKVAAISLAPGKSVQIVTLINKAYILGVSDDSVNLIAEVTDEELINDMNVYADKTDKTNRPKSFEEVLELFMPKKKAGQGSEKKTSVYDGATKQILDSLKNKTFGKKEE